MSSHSSTPDSSTRDVDTDQTDITTAVATDVIADSSSRSAVLPSDTDKQTPRTADDTDSLAALAAFRSRVDAWRARPHKRSLAKAAALAAIVGGDAVAADFLHVGGNSRATPVGRTPPVRRTPARAAALAAIVAAIDAGTTDAIQHADVL